MLGSRAAGIGVGPNMVVRTIPLLLLIMLPWTVEHFSGRAFTVRALGLSTIDIVGGWAVVAVIETMAAIVLLRRVLTRQ